jgi:uncharacterized protein (TIGR02145 family)
MSQFSKYSIFLFSKLKLFIFIICNAQLLLLHGCKKEKIEAITLGKSEVKGNSVTLLGITLNLNLTKTYKKGFCYANTENPTIEDNVLLDNNSGNRIIVELTDLEDIQQYYFRAFVEQNGELSYGTNMSFITGKSWLNNNMQYESISDIDNNSYPVITINNRKWMAENLRTTRFSNGDLIANIQSDLQWSQTTSPAWCFQNNDESKNIPNGKFYNGYAVTDNRNICPAGWHVPTYNEWVQMLISIDSNVINNPIENEAGAELKSTGTRFWSPPNTGGANQTGFSATGADYRQDSGAINQHGYGAYWWSADLSGLTGQWLVELSTYNTRANLDVFAPSMGLSVRCIQNQ